MFKLFGGKSSSKSKSGKSGDVSKKAQPNEYGMTPEEMAEAERSLGVISGRQDRLSISKSGRHKLKGKQRMNLQEDTYATRGSMGAPLKSANAPSYNPAPTSSNPRGQNSNAQSARVGGQGSLGRNSQQGSLGRSTGGHCGVVQQSTESKRYPTGPKNIPRQQTAV